MAAIAGGSGGDYLTAWADGDVLLGYGGNDFLAGNAFLIRAEGGAGDDIYSLHHAADEAVESRSGGNDTIWYYGADAFVLADEVENLEFFSEAGTDAEGNALSNLIVGNGGINRLSGGAGDDILRGAGGGDRLEGGEGDDFLDPGSGASAIAGGGGRDILYVNKESVEAHIVVEDFDLGSDRMQVRGFWDYSVSQDGADALVAFSPYVTVRLAGIDAASVGPQHFDLAPRPDEHTFVGTDNGESLYGWANGDRCFGLDGNDYLGDHNADWSELHGGNGDDTYEVNNALDQVVEAAGEGDDTVWVYMSGEYRLAENVERLIVTGAMTVLGNEGGNHIQGSGGDDTIGGLGGDDVIRASFGADLIDGGEGDDFLDGGGGESTIVGGAGADTIFVDWESGNHVVEDFNVAEDRFEAWTFTGYEQLTQVGEDTLVVFWTGYGGDPTAMTSVLLEGVDAASLGAANFTFSWGGTALAEKLTGGAYSDEINGAGGADRMGGRGGEDSLFGGAGGDTIWGGLGSDYLAGGGGDDVILGNAGRDLMHGGGGGDRFVFRYAGDSRTVAADRIFGFDAGSGDVIDLSMIDADAGTDGDQAFAFVSSFGGTGGEAVLAYDAARNRTTLMLDLDGDAAADFTLMVNGHLNAETGWAL